MRGTKNGPYLVTCLRICITDVGFTDEPDDTKGSLTTANFSPEGRLQLSVVVETLVHKLKYFKK